MEIWGYCAACDEWFACERWFDRQAPPPCCPTCGRDPQAIENRTALRRHVVVTGAHAAMPRSA